MSTIPMALFLLNFMGLSDVLTISRIPRFLCSLHCRVIVLSLCTILTIAVPDNSCRKGAITLTYLLHPGFSTKVSCGNRGGCPIHKSKFRMSCTVFSFHFMHVFHAKHYIYIILYFRHQAK